MDGGSPLYYKSIWNANKLVPNPHGQKPPDIIPHRHLIRSIYQMVLEQYGILLQIGLTDGLASGPITAASSFERVEDDKHNVVD